MNINNLFIDSNINGIDIKEIPCDGMSKETWVSVRNSLTGIGGSEIGCLVGMNKYKSSVRLFYEKVGLWKSNVKDNIRMFMGRYLEDAIVDLWQYHDGTELGMIANQEAGRRIKECKIRHAMIVNPDVPWLFANLDGEITKHPDFDGCGILECKHQSSYAVDQWAGKVAPSYLWQMDQYMLVTNSDYAELARWVDGIPEAPIVFKRSSLQDEIILEKSYIFMQNVKEGLERIANLPDAKRDELIQAVMELEPPPDGTEDYVKFLSEKHKYSLTLREEQAPDPIIDYAYEWIRMRDQMKELKAKKNYTEGLIKSEMANRRIGKYIVMDDHMKHITFKKRFGIYLR